MTNLSMPRCDIEELKGQIEQLKALNTADDYLIKLLEEQNQQLKDLLKECREKSFEIRLALSSGRINDTFDLTYQIENKIDNAIGEKK